MPKFTREFTVSGCGVFPFDMLRYDHCWPADQESAVSLDCGTRPEERKEVRTIRLRMVTERKDVLPTIDRWKSFQWTVHKDIPEARKW